MNIIYEYSLLLIRYILKGDIPKLPQDIDFHLLYEFGQSHGIDNMLYLALQELKVDVPAEIMEKFKNAYQMQIVIEATQAVALEELEQLFENAHIRHIPLKGSIIKNIYPMPDYRKSSDIDILVHADDIDRVDAVMKESGYEIDKMDEYELHEGYRKPPFILVEIHDRLLEKNNRSYGLFADIWKSEDLVRTHGTTYAMSKELFYVFSVAHCCKHVKNGGAGIKFITDIYLMQTVWQEEFNKDKLKALLSQARLSEFEGWLRSICSHWFDGIEPNDRDVLQLEKFILSGGSFGSLEQAKALKKSAMAISRTERFKYKLRKTFSGVFVKYESMRAEYPILIKHKFLLPVMWVIRIVKILKNRELAKEKLHSAYSVNENQAKELQNLWKAVC